MKCSREIKYQMKNKPMPKKFFTEKRKDDLITYGLAFLISLIFVSMIFIYIIYA